MSTFEPVLLPDEVKQEMCEALLVEFGATSINTRSNGEMIVRCVLPWHPERRPSASLNYQKMTYKCVSADTVIKTFDGDRRIADLVGQTVQVLDGRGKWVRAPIKHYGRDRLYRVTLSRNGIKREVHTTADHRWYVRAQGSHQNGSGGLQETTTAALRPRQRIPSVWPMRRTGRTTLSPHWWVTSVEPTDRVEDVYCAEVETTQSFVLADNILTGNCLGCGSGGGLLWLIATCRGVSGPEARGWLESTGAVGGSTTFDLTALLAYLDALERARDQRREPVPMPVFSERVLEPWDRICPLLTTGVPDLGLPGRGIPEDNLRTARVGWNTDAMRVVIPHWWKGDLVGWQSRRLTDDGSPKYESTVDFPRDRTIYRLPERSDTLVVVESPMSVLRHLHHLDIAATFGAAITEQQILLMRWYPRVVFWLDNDPAGWEALEGKPDPATRSWRPGALERVSAYTQVAVVDSDWHADPADLDDDEADRLVQEAVPHTLWHRPTGALRCLRCRQPHGGYCADQTTGELVRG